MKIFKSILITAALFSISTCRSAESASSMADTSAATDTPIVITTPVSMTNDECIAGLLKVPQHDGWTVEWRTAACTNANGSCVLTLAALRPVDFNQELLNQECRFDDNGCVATLATAFAKNGNLWWWRGDLVSFCSDDDLTCVLKTKKANPTMANQNIHGKCMLKTSDLESTVNNYNVYGVGENSAQATAIINVANKAAAAFLQNSVGLSTEGATAIGSRNNYSSLHDIVNLPISHDDFQKLAQYANKN